MKTSGRLMGRLALLSLLLLSHIGSLQASVPDSLVAFMNRYQNFSRDYAQEKVYLFFDNDSYYLGENIWFKAYVLLAENHRYTPMSHTLYVELLSSDGNVVDKLKLKIEDGQTKGVFYLNADKLSAGFYEIRAYTRCMLNFNQDCLFSRVFPVFDRARYDENGLRQSPTMKVQKPALPYRRPGHDMSDREQREAAKAVNQIDFYPEGGHLVAGIENQVAFATGTTQDGIILANGTVSDETGQTVAEFESLFEGMGMFSFTPESGHSYTCHVNFQNRRFDKTLPTPEERGIALKVDNLDENILSIGMSPKGYGSADTLAFLITCRGRIYGYRFFVLDGRPLQLDYDKRRLPSGVNELLIIDGTGRILASRMFFVQNPADDPRVYRLGYAFDRTDYQPFSPVHVRFNLEGPRDSSGHYPPLSLPVSIRDGYDGFDNLGSVSPYAELLLSSDLKGHINRPDQYFERNDLRHRRMLDLLMMVQGWRRYEWEIMSSPREFNLRHPVEEGILLQGHILSVIKHKPLKDLKVTMWMISDSLSFHGNCQTDKQGEFDFLFDFEGKWNLSLMVTDESKRKNCFITIDRQFSPDARQLNYYETQAPVYRVKQVENQDRLYEFTDIERGEIHVMPGDVLLKEAEVIGKKSTSALADVSIVYQTTEEMDKLQDEAEYTYEELDYFLTQINPNFFFRANPKAYSQDGLTGSDNIEVLYYKSARVIFYDTRRSLSSEKEEFVMPLVSEVETIEIVEPGSRNAALDDDISTDMKDVAYVLLTTYEGNAHQEEKVGLRKTTLQGYNKVKDFYHPRYDKSLTPDYQDHRRTLYWNPDLKTDSQGKAEIRFYNSASGKQFQVESAFITSEGRIGSIAQ